MLVTPFVSFRNCFSLISLWILAFCLCGCVEAERAGADDPKTADAESEQAITVYCGRSEALVGPVFEKYEEATGRSLAVVYSGTPSLATRVLAEKRESPADVVFFQDSGYLGALAAGDLLAELPGEIFNDIDSRFYDEDRHWIGTSGRARVLVYNTETVASDELPKSLRQLAEPKWKGKLGWAPTNSSFEAHVSALRHIWGEAETRGWLEKMKANEPRVYPKNSPQVIAADAGEISIGWVNHYYLHKLKKDGFKAANYSFPIEGDAGNVLMVSGVGVMKGSEHRTEVLDFVRWLIAEDAQTYFANESFEYPTRTGVATHADVPPLGELRLRNVDQAWLADIGPTVTLLQELKIQ